MSNIYIVPASGDFAELLEASKRAGVPFEHPKTLREFILLVGEQDTCIVALEEKTMLLLTRYSDELLVDVPTAVNSVPGLVYNRDWGRIISTIPVVDWMEMKQKLSKSGHTAFSTKQMADRVSDLPQASTGPKFTPTMDASTEDDDLELGDTP